MPDTFLIGGHLNKKLIYRNYIFGSFLKERLQGPQECEWLRDESHIFFYLRTPLRSPLTLRIAPPNYWAKKAAVQDARPPGHRAALL